MGVKNMSAVVKVTLTGFSERNDAAVYIPSTYIILSNQ